ncbi:copper-binding protein [Falsiroseomonas tokyonensis]|uniref:Copper-binding protein n=1 Tax=Falsiroseomonas tokyonensis TaxID=430521 RepID=A0ABV7C248_9PROT|nr:copper-binding protein [Falsiroseomonas tokyonensis]MBU8541922.1 copper-binding protein [Falsiroseomonas tokyonensis]
MTTRRPLTMAAAAAALLTLTGAAGHAQQGSAAIATGTVQKVDAAGRMLSLAHGPIPEIRWPAMTMDFPVAPGVDLSALTPGRQVEFTLAPRPGAGGGYVVTRVVPKG